MNKKVTAIIQARLSSTRFPNKVIYDLDGIPLISFLIKRVKRSTLIDKIILATTKNKEDDILEKIANENNILIFRGEKNNVLKRFADASKITDSDNLIRITGDCPLIDSEIIDQCIVKYFDKNYDYFSNCNPPTFPDGLDVEIFAKKVLLKANNLSKNIEDKEHVTMWMKNNKSLRIGNLENDFDHSSIRITVDEPEDLDLVRKIVEHFKGYEYFNLKDILKFYAREKEIFKINKKFKRNEGSNMNTGQKLWKRAKKSIPTGNMLLSKNPDMFLPNKWPAYFEKAKGINIWDLDNQKYIDMSIMGIGTNILGYANKQVDKAVAENLYKGNMSTLNCPEEVLLAEKLICLNPWADMVRFTRGGGEANAVCIRIARAYTGLDNIAICGYHGWHDWYLAANLNSKDSLNKHLLPGLLTDGVPKNLGNTIYPFSYNRIEELEKIIKNNKLAAVKMEVERNFPPNNNFLLNVRRLCNENNIILIFDECTSGFRETYGGLYKKYGIEPDMIMFGKALGNGYAINAILGRKAIMEAVQNTFISSTFWTERIGPTAALKTLEIMKEKESWNYITELGKYLKNGWRNIAKENNLKIEQFGIPALAGFKIISPNFLKYKTYISQEMLKKGILASNICYLSTCHTKPILDYYFESLDSIFKTIEKCEDGLDINKLLESEICKTSFRRLN